MDSTHFNFRGVHWRIHLGILPPPPSSVDDLRRAAARSRRRYQMLRRSLLVDLHLSLEEGRSSEFEFDNPLSQSPDSIWGWFFQNAELEKILDQDLSRLYLGDGSFFQKPSCQSMLCRILMLWSLKHPDYGYRQGMHELLAPLLYVLHIDLQHLSQVQGMYKVHFEDDIDIMSILKSGSNSKDLSLNITRGDSKNYKVDILHDLDPETRHVFLLNDAYGVEGELGIILSERYIEHDAYCMFESLLNGGGGVPAVADFFSSIPTTASAVGLTPVLEASSALFNLLLVMDPSLHSHFVELGVEPQYFALRWLRVLFGREFSLDDLLVIWDEILSYPNNSSTPCIDNTMELYCRSLCSERGAFISALAISMLHSLRSSLLATENATTCLQRLLNSPAIDVRILIEKAKSLHTFVLDVNMSFDSTRSKHKTRRRHSISFGSASPQNPTYDLPESYWEERWKLMHSKNEFQKVNPGEIIPGVMNEVSRAESELPSIKPVSGVKDALYSARRKLLKNFSRGRDFQTALKESITEDQDVTLSNIRSLSTGFHDSLQEQPDEFIICTGEKACSREEENFVLSTTNSPLRMVHARRNKSEESSVTSSSYDMHNNDDLSQVEVEYYSNIDINKDMPHEPEQTYETTSEHEQNTDDRDDKGTSLKEQTTPSRFQWFRRLSNVCAKRELVEERKDNIPATSDKGGNLEDIKDPLHLFGDLETKDKKLMDTLRTLGQSMLENIQVIESGLQQECKEGNLPNKSSVSMEEATAAVDKLRNISKLLCRCQSDF